MELRNTSLHLGTATVVAFTAGASTASAALFVGRANGFYVLRIQTDQDCMIAINTAPTASATSSAFTAGSVEYVNVTPGDKVAVWGKSTAGTVSLTEMG